MASNDAHPSGPSCIFSWLYLGRSWDASPKRLQEQSLTHCLNVRGGSIPSFPSGKAYKCKVLSDYGDTQLGPSGSAESIVRFLSQVKRSKDCKVLVYCQMSVNRSPTAVLLYLMHPDGHNMSFREALTFLQAKHRLSRPHPRYILQLLDLEMQWRGSSSLTEAEANEILAEHPTTALLRQEALIDTELVARTTAFVQALVELFDSRSSRSADRGPTLLTETLNGEEYEARRALWNGLVERKPAAIVCPYDALDVSDVVKLALNFNVKLSVRGGGHNVAGVALQDGVVGIDLCHLQAVHYDQTTHLVQAGGGALWRDVDRATTSFQRACVSGLISHTGVGGLTLGGGIGWMSRLYGLACDSLVGAEVVTGTGDILKVDGEQSAELLWALRGGGGNFGVCTSLTLQSHPVHSALYCFVYWDNSDPANRAARDAIMTEYEAYCRNKDLPSWACAFLWLIHGSTMIVFIDIVDVAENEESRWQQQEERIRPLFAQTEPTWKDFQCMSMAELNSRFDEGSEHGSYYYWSKSTLLPEGLPPNFGSLIAGELVDKHTDVTVELMHLGGRLTEQIDSAFFQRPNLCGFECHAIGVQRLSDAVLRTREDCLSTWRPSLREFTAKLTSFSATGASYLNIEAPDQHLQQGPAFLSDVFGTHWNRLRDIKTRYDPTNIFAFNHNIPPHTAESQL